MTSGQTYSPRPTAISVYRARRRLSRRTDTTGAVAAGVSPAEKAGDAASEFMIVHPLMLWRPQHRQPARRREARCDEAPISGHEMKDGGVQVAPAVRGPAA